MEFQFEDVSRKIIQLTDLKYVMTVLAMTHT